MRISDWSSDVCSSDLLPACCRVPSRPRSCRPVCYGTCQGKAPNFYTYARTHVGSCISMKGRRPSCPGRFLFKTDRCSWPRCQSESRDRKSDVEGKRVEVREDLGGRRISKKKITNRNT